jgi:hypothetical protein
MFLNIKNTRLKYSAVGIGTEEVYENESLFFLNTAKTRIKGAQIHNNRISRVLSPESPEFSLLHPDPEYI